MANFNDSFQQVARELGVARKTCCQLSNVPLSLHETSAYKLQSEVADWLSGQGYGQPAGYKVGLVSADIRAWLGGLPVLGIDEPVYGPLLSATLFHGKAEVPFDSFIRPYVEGEFGVRIGEDVPPGQAPFSPESIADFVDECFAGIELVDWRVDYLNCAPPLAPIMIADGGSNWGAVVGLGCREWRKADIFGLAATMYVDGQPIHTGHASDLEGNPMRILAWLANKLSHQGSGLHAGDIVLLGAVTPSYKDFGKGAEIIVDWDLFGSVGVRFT
jgi:2-keto-4-pentenoate hydratase